MIQNGPQNVVKVTFVAMRARCFLYLFFSCCASCAARCLDVRRSNLGRFGVKFDEWRGKNAEKLMAEILDENVDILTSAKRLENACKAVKLRQFGTLCYSKLM